MKVSLWPLAKITPYEHNPRVHGEAIDAAAASIKAFKFRQPIVVDAAGVIIVGHARFEAAKQLGLKRVPVHVAEDLTPEQVRAYRIADNKTAELAEWDYELLSLELRELNKVDFDVTVLGFDEAELALLVDGAADATGRDPGQSAYRGQYGVIVLCKSESHQQKVFKQLTAAGHECRVVCT